MSTQNLANRVSIIIIAPNSFNFPEPRRDQPNVHQMINEEIKYGISIAMEYYFAIKRNEILIHAITHMNLKKILC